MAATLATTTIATTIATATTTTTTATTLAVVVGASSTTTTVVATSLATYSAVLHKMKFLECPHFGIVYFLEMYVRGTKPPK